MSLTVNGQPSTNTVVRLDGITATNQFFENIQSYGPSLEAIETVNVVTSSFDADQGMAGAAAVNVQVKTGTNNFRGSAFEYATDARMRARNYFLPADRDKGTSSVTCIRRHRRRSDCEEQAVLLRERRDHAPAHVQRQCPGVRPARAGSCRCRRHDLRRGDFSQTRRRRIYDPLTGDSTTGVGRVPFAFANCPGSPRRPTRASPRATSSRRIASIRSRRRCSRKLVQPTQPGYTNNYFVVNGYDTTYSQDRREDHLQPGSEAEPERAASASCRAGSVRSASCRRSTDRAFNPIAQGREWDSFVDSHSIGATSILSQNFVVDGSFGYTKHNVHVFPPVDTCDGRPGRHSECLPAAELARHQRARHARDGWVLNGESPIRDYVDPQWQIVANAGWTQGLAQRQVRCRLHHPRTRTTTRRRRSHFTFNGGVTVLPGGAAANNFNRFASFLLGLPVVANRPGDDPADRRRRVGRAPSELGLAEHVPAEHPAQLTTSAPTCAISGTYAEDHGIGRPAVGVLLAAARVPITASRSTTSTSTGC